MKMILLLPSTFLDNDDVMYEIFLAFISMQLSWSSLPWDTILSQVPQLHDI